MINTNSGRNSPFSNQENTIGALYNNLKNNSNTHTITMNTLHISDSSTNWEDLRRQARHIEQDLDVKLVSFSKLGSSSTSGGSSNLDRFGDGRHRSHHSTLDFDNEDAMSHVSGKNNDQTSNDDMFRTMAMEINSLLQNLENINNSLLDFSNQGNNNSNVSMLHSLQRHRDILQDFQSEFNKIKSNIENKRQREDLLGSVRRDIDMHYRQQKQMNNRGMNDSSAATDAFLGERQRLLNSDKLRI